MSTRAILILAGGLGTRFWPLSNQEKPKQFSRLFSERSLIQETWDRVVKLVPEENIFISTFAGYEEQVQEHLPDLKPENIISEPQQRNTAPALIYCVDVIGRKLGKDALVFACPADHRIEAGQEFEQSFETGCRFLEEKDASHILTFGLVPTEPHTGYGYIKPLASGDLKEVLGVERFVEKPNVETAEKYLEDGNYLWNSGMFLFQVGGFLNEAIEHVPGCDNFLKQRGDLVISGFQTVAEEHYKLIEATSIDYGLLEKSSKVSVLRATFQWSDVGNWSALWNLLKRDDSNAVSGESVLMESCEGTLVMNQSDNKVCVVGLKDMIVVHTGDSVLVCHKNKDQRVGKISSTLTKETTN